MASAAVKARLKALRRRFGLGEFSGSRKAKRRPTRKRGVQMARRGSRRRSGGRRSFGGSLGRGLMPGLRSGFMGEVLAGAGAATLSEAIPVVNTVPYSQYGAAFIVAGLGGVAGAVIRDVAKGKMAGASGAGTTTESAYN